MCGILGVGVVTHDATQAKHETLHDRWLWETAPGPRLLCRALPRMEKQGRSTCRAYPISAQRALFGRWVREKGGEPEHVLYAPVPTQTTRNSGVADFRSGLQTTMLCGRLRKESDGSIGSVLYALVQDEASWEPGVARRHPGQDEVLHGRGLREQPSRSRILRCSLASLAKTWRCADCQSAPKGTGGFSYSPGLSKTLPPRKPDGEFQAIRLRAPVRHGRNDRSATLALGIGPSQEWGYSRQSPRKSRVVGKPSYRWTKADRLGCLGEGSFENLRASGSQTGEIS